MTCDPVLTPHLDLYLGLVLGLNSLLLSLSSHFLSPLSFLILSLLTLSSSSYFPSHHTSSLTLFHFLSPHAIFPIIFSPSHVLSPLPLLSLSPHILSLHSLAILKFLTLCIFLSSNYDFGVKDKCPKN